MKKILIFILIACTALSLISCSGTPSSADESTSLTSTQQTETSSPEALPDGAIEVFSGYPLLNHIVPGEIDMSKVEDGIWARYGYRAYVSKLKETLVIIPQHNHGSSSVTDVQQSELYNYYNIHGGVDGVFVNGEKIIDAQCEGIISTASRKMALVLTTDGNDSTIYVFEKETSEGDFDQPCKEIKLDGKILLYFINRINHFDPFPNDLYILTSTSVVVMKNYHNLTAEFSESYPYEMITLETPDWWKYIKPNSATLLNDGSLFIGSLDGVVGIKDGVITYYPIDFPDFITR